MILIKEISKTLWYDHDRYELNIEVDGRDLRKLSLNGEIDPYALVSVIVNGEKKQPKVKNAIFHDQATILFWEDGEKTVVKCHECGDGKCIYDKDFDLFLLDGENVVLLDDVAKLDKAVENVARCAFCQTHFDREKAVMAGMLKRLYPNFQNVLRDALEGDDE